MMTSNCSSSNESSGLTAPSRAATRSEVPPEDVSDCRGLGGVLLHVALEILRREDAVHVITPSWLDEQIRHMGRRGHKHALPTLTLSEHGAA